MLHDDDVVGEVTSGTFSPTFDRPIAMAYEARVDARIPAPLANGTRLRFGEVRVLFLLPESFRPWVLSRNAPAGE